MTEALLGGRVTLYPGDCRDVLKTLPDNSIDSVVTDPPYALVFMGKQWDTGETAFAVEFWAEVYRVLKPGGHVASFSGTRTYHRMACAIEDAGFEIRDQLAWAYGSGFPKSHDVSKGIDKRKDWKSLRELQGVIRTARAASGKTLKQVGEQCGEEWWHRGGYLFFETGLSLPTVDQWRKLKVCLSIGDAWDAAFQEAEREVVGQQATTRLAVAPGQGNDRSATTLDITAPRTAAAREWQGWGTALKPAWEPICLARKPLIGTVAANVLQHGTGALNIAACRVGDEVLPELKAGQAQIGTFVRHDMVTPERTGRWPANLMHDGSDEVVAAFPDSKASSGEFFRKETLGTESNVNIASRRDELAGIGFGDSGSAARFFYTSKADAEDRIGSKHPTVKPLDLMQWLCRLITPPGGTILDPFAGTGTTGEAAWREGFNAVLIEREAEYCAEVRTRMHLALEPTKRAAMAAGRGVLRGAEGTPLFGGEIA